MKKWTLLFDVDRCNGCCNCVLATMDEYVGNTHPGYSDEMPRHGSPWLDMLPVERGVFPVIDVAYKLSTCQHCENAPCVREFPEAVSQRKDGIVMIDPERARGNRALVDACPLGAIHWNEEKQVAQNWNLDAHLLDAGWKEPRAAQACPTAALRVMKLTEHELTELRRLEGVEQSALGKTLGSRLYFKGGHRLASQLIGGSAATSIDGREEPLCAQRMELFSDGKLMAATHTDSLGNFRFDRLGEVGDEITLVLHHEGRKYQRCVKKTNGSFSVGVMYIEPPVGEIKPAAPDPQTVSI